jgi:hypothetical protein
MFSSHALLISLTALSSVSFALLSVSCGVAGDPGVHRRANRVLHQWHDDGGDGRISIRISLTDQIAEFKRGEREIGWCYVATGKEGHGTAPGNYKITEKIEDKHSNLYGWFEDEFGNVTDGDARSRDKVPEGMTYVAAPMPYWMRLTSYGVGMHGGLIPEPGKPASHGCIRLPKEFVPLLFDAVVVGTPVTITNAPSKRSRLEIDGRPPNQDAISEQVMTGNSNEFRVDGSADSVTYRNGLPTRY